MAPGSYGRRMNSITTPKPIRLTAAALMALAAPAAVLSAQSPAAPATPPTFKVAAGARLYVPAAAPASGRAAAWVVFRTSPHTNARLTVVTVAGRSGRSYAASGAANCIRSAVPVKAGRRALKAGSRYRVSFYARAGTGHSSPRRLITTRDLTAARFTAPATGLGTPHC
jgi:hypothetical protein